MAEDFRTIKEKKAEGTPFTNGLFFGLLLGILISIAVTLFITNGKSPFISKETIGSCIEVNSAIGEEDVINIDEDTTFDFYQTLPQNSTTYDNEGIDKKKEIASKGRKTSQPLKYRSAGSVFKNPKGDFAAGSLIEQVGLKGYAIGNAQISDHHANFFINHGNAKAKDIMSLIKISKEKVFQKFNINLELEVKALGFSKKD